jgi:hypothetical protein
MCEFQERLKRKLIQIHNSRQVNEIDVSQLDAESCRGLLYILDKQEHEIRKLKVKNKRGY